MLVLDGTYDSGANYSLLVLYYRQQIASELGIPINQISLTGIYDGSILLQFQILSNLDNVTLVLQQSLTSAPEEVGGNSLGNVTDASDCNPSEAPPLIFGLDSIDCEGKVKAGDKCLLNPKINFSCTVEVTCLPSGMYKVAGACSAVCHGVNPTNLNEGVRNVTCSTATNGGEKCYIVAQKHYDCSSFSLECNQNGTGSYNSIGSCVRQCTGNSGELTPISGASVSCNSAIDIGSACEIQDLPHYNCSKLLKPTNSANLYITQYFVVE